MSTKEAKQMDKGCSLCAVAAGRRAAVRRPARKACQALRPDRKNRWKVIITFHRLKAVQQSDADSLVMQVAVICGGRLRVIAPL